MNFFAAENEAVYDPNTPTLNTWDLLDRKELQLLVTHPPVNSLEQMIRWTEQGRLWRFPIDNEQGASATRRINISIYNFQFCKCIKKSLLYRSPKSSQIFANRLKSYYSLRNRVEAL